MVKGDEMQEKDVSTSLMDKMMMRAKGEKPPPKAPPPKDGPGSVPRVLSADELDQLKRLSPMLVDYQLADYFMVSLPTFKKILERQPEVNTILKHGRAALSSEIQLKLFEKARKGHLGAICFFLKTQNQWSETTKLEVITEEKPSTTTIIDVFDAVAISDDEDDTKLLEEDKDG